MGLEWHPAVQSQIAFNLLLIWTVTGETFLTEDGGDIPIKIDSRRMQGTWCAKEYQTEPTQCPELSERFEVREVNFHGSWLDGSRRYTNLSPDHAMSKASLQSSSKGFS